MIKNLEILGLDQSQTEVLNTRAELHQRYSNITFKVLDADNGVVVLRIAQGKNHGGNYFDNKRLHEIGVELFEGVADLKIQSRPIVYSVPGPDAVTPEWLNNQIMSHGLKVKDMAAELGIDPNSISAFRSGVRPMSGVQRAAFWFYFKSK